MTEENDKLIAQHKAYLAEDSRLSRLEAVVENLARDVGDLKDVVIAGGKTNWSVLASWAAVLLAIISILGSGYVADLTRLEKRVEEERTQIYSMYEDHARLDQRLKIFETERDHRLRAEAKIYVEALHNK